jgi:hypothetical protein
VATLTEALKWLEEGKPKRAATAKKFPTTRASGSPSRTEFAKAVLDEGKTLLADKATLHRGLMQLKGVLERWPDTEAGRAARKILEEYEAKPQKPWEVEDVAELRKQLLVEARALADYALNGIPAGSPYEKSRPALAAQAAEYWTALVMDAPDADYAKEGKKLLAQLKPLVEKK